MTICKIKFLGIEFLDASRAGNRTRDFNRSSLSFLAFLLSGPFAIRARKHTYVNYYYYHHYYRNTTTATTITNFYYDTFIYLPNGEEGIGVPTEG